MIVFTYTLILEKSNTLHIFENIKIIIYIVEQLEDFLFQKKYILIIYHYLKIVNNRDKIFISKLTLKKI